METKRLLPLGGIAFVALLLLAILGLSSGSPSSTTDLADVVAYYQDNNAEQFIASIVLAAAVPFLVLFALGVAAVRSADEGPTVWTRMLVGGSFVVGAVLLVTAMANFALADGADNGASPAALQALNLLVGDSWVALNAGLGVLMLGGAGTFLSRPRSNWLGWSAVVLGVALFVPFADFFALLLTGPWMIAAGIAVSRRREPQPAAQTAASLS